MPADYVGLLSVGVQRGDRVITLTTRKGLVRDRPPGAASAPAASTVVVPLDGYGTGGGTNEAGHYLLDETGGQLVLDADVPGDVDELYCEYIGTGIVTTGETVVPAYAEFALLSYLDWKMIEKLRSVPRSEKQVAQQEHFRQMRRLVKLRSKVTPKDAREALSNSYSLTVR